MRLWRFISFWCNQCWEDFLSIPFSRYKMEYTSIFNSRPSGMKSGMVTWQVPCSLVLNGCIINLVARKWPRVQSSHQRPHWIHVDFEHFEDEEDDEEEEEEEVPPEKRERIVSVVPSSSLALHQGHSSLNRHAISERGQAIADLNDDALKRNLLQGREETSNYTGFEFMIQKL